MKRIYDFTLRLQRLLLAVMLFLLSGLLPNGFGSNVDVAIAQATEHPAPGSLSGCDRCRTDPGHYQRF